MGGWFSGLLSKVIPRGPNQMILPDDSKKSVIIIIIIIIIVITIIRKLFLLRVVLITPNNLHMVLCLTVHAHLNMQKYRLFCRLS